MPKSPDYFAGKTILITGAASGIGRAAALVFAREKANVACVDIDEAGVEKTAEKINEIGSQALALTIDVTKRAAVEDMVQLAIDGFGGVQFLFNSAGAAIRRAKFLEIDDDLLDKTFDLNVKGTFYTMQAVLPHNALQQIWCDRQHGQHGAPAWRSRLLGALRGGQRSGRDDDDGCRAGICDAGYSRTFDFPGPVKTPFRRRRVARRIWYSASSRTFP